MTYFLLSITNTCNKSCEYCVVKPWLNNPEYPDKATAEDFISFLEKEMQPDDIVELTGGEPTLFPNLLLLLEWLKEHGARVIMRTNGFKLGAWRKDFPNMIVVLARHDSDDEYMTERRVHLLEYDVVSEKIPEGAEQTEPNMPVHIKSELYPLDSHGIKRALFITNDGNIKFMPCMDVSMGNIIDLNYNLNQWDCISMSRCPYMLGAWNLITKLEQTNWNSVPTN